MASNFTLAKNTLGKAYWWRQNVEIDVPVNFEMFKNSIKTLSNNNM